MPRVFWPLHRNRPVVQVRLRLPTGQTQTKNLLADTGAGPDHARFQLILNEVDCQLCGNATGQLVPLRGAYDGLFPGYQVRIGIPGLNLDQVISTIGVPAPPVGFDGIACFRFLNQFTYGNFGRRDRFGLET